MINYMTATLINNVTGVEIPVTSTTNHVSCNYGMPVWVDEDNQAYLQVGSESLQPFYSIKDISDMEEYKKYIPIGI